MRILGWVCTSVLELGRSLLLWAAVAWFLVLAAPARVWAGPIEVLSSVEVAKSDPDRIVARWIFGDGGMYVSSDRGASFQGTCFGALGANVQGRNVISFKTTADGSLCVGTPDSVFCSDAKMCGWTEAAELRGQWPADFAADPVDADVLYLVTGTSEGKNGVYVRETPAGAWKPLGAQSNAWFSRLHVVERAGGKRFYVSSLENVEAAGEDGGAPTEETQYYLRYSDDRAATWTSHRYEAVPPRASLRLLAVDPTNPERIVIGTLRTAENSSDELLYSDRGGEPGSFTKIGEVIEFSGAAFGPDGAFYYGDNDRMMPGLFKVAKLGDAPVKLTGSYKVSCLGFDPAGERLYVCSDWLLGTADPATGELTTLFDMREASELLRCDGETTTAHACAAAFLAPNFCDPTHYPRAPICSRYFGGAAGAGGQAAAGQGSAGSAGRVGGASGAGGAAAGSDGSGNGDGCGCVAAGAGRAPGPGAMLAIGLVLGLIGRRVRRRRSQSCR